VEIAGGFGDIEKSCMRLSAYGVQARYPLEVELSEGEMQRDKQPGFPKGMSWCTFVCLCNYICPYRVKIRNGEQEEESDWGS